MCDHVLICVCLLIATQVLGKENSGRVENFGEGLTRWGLPLCLVIHHASVMSTAWGMYGLSLLCLIFYVIECKQFQKWLTFYIDHTSVGIIFVFVRLYLPLPSLFSISNFTYFGKSVPFGSFHGISLVGWHTSSLNLIFLLQTLYL